jgi:putative SOS response-associated peptidase YedK
VSGDIRDRAPVILEEGVWGPWLTGETAEAAREIKDAREPKLIYHPVPKAVGSPENDSPNLVEPVGISDE